MYRMWKVLETHIEYRPKYYAVSNNGRSFKAEKIKYINLMTNQAFTKHIDLHGLKNKSTMQFILTFENNHSK